MVTVSYQDEVREILDRFESATATLREEADLNRERLRSARKAAAETRKQAKAEAEKRFQRTAITFERARALVENSSLSPEDRSSRHSLLMGSYTAKDDKKPDSASITADYGKEIDRYTENAERALRYLQQLKGSNDAGEMNIIRLLRLGMVIAGLFTGLGIIFALSAVAFGAAPEVLAAAVIMTLAGMMVLAIGPQWMASRMETRFSSPASAFDALTKSIAASRRAFRRWIQQIDEQYQYAVREATEALNAAVDSMSPAFDQALATLRPRVADLEESLEAWTASWYDERWNTWTPGAIGGPAIRLGTITAAIDSLRLSVPALLSLPAEKSLLFRAGGAGYARALEAARALIFRMLVTQPVAHLQLTVIDGSGKAASIQDLLELTEYNESLVNYQVWSSPDEIRRQLENMLIVVAAAERQEEPEDDGAQSATTVSPDGIYRMVVVYGFPEGFDGESARLLARLMQTGPRYGVWCVVLLDTGLPLPNIRLSEMEAGASVLSWKDNRFIWQEPGFSDYIFTQDPPPHTALAKKLILAVGAQVSTYTALFEQIVPPRHEWQKPESASGLDVLLGRWPNDDTFKLQFGGPRGQQHLLVVGPPQSGKTTLLRSLATGLILGYQPDVLHLYLYDASDDYALSLFEEAPAVQVYQGAIGSDRRVGLFQSLRSEMHRISALRRRDASASSRLTALTGGTPIPRVVVVIDGAEELFARRDTLAGETERMLTNLITLRVDTRLHIVLSTSSPNKLPSDVRDLFMRGAGRVVLSGQNESMAQLTGMHLQENAHLTETGWAVYNPGNGRAESSSLFRIAHVGTLGVTHFLQDIPEVPEEAEEDPEEWGPILRMPEPEVEDEELPVLSG